MSRSTHLLTLNIESETAVEWVTQRLKDKGLQVIRSFDLQVARAAHVDCTCPHHGTAQCDCQMIVLLVYGQGVQPLTLVAHGHEGKTHFAMVDSPEQEHEGLLGKMIVHVLTAERLSALRRGQVHAN
jgi:hypothetical protein